MNKKTLPVEKYRERVYRYYTSARPSTLAPDTLEGLRPRAPYIRKIIKDHFPSSKKSSILDLGCGYGAIIYFATQVGYTQIKGVDISIEQVEASKRLGIHGVELGDLMDVLKNQPPTSLNVVLAFDLLEHFHKDELVDLVDEVQRVLCSGGVLIIHTVNGASPFFGGIRYGDFTHELAFTRSSISQLFLSSGFSEVACFEDAPIPHGIKSSIRWLLWQLIRIPLRFYLAVETGEISNNGIFSQNFLAVIRK